MSKFVVLKSAGLGNRIKLYVSYLQRYDELLIEKEPDLYLFENFKLCNKEEDIKKRGKRDYSLLFKYMREIIYDSNSFYI